MSCCAGPAPISGCATSGAGPQLASPGEGFGAWGREITPDYTPFEAGLGRFVDLGKDDFIGRDAALRARDQGPERRLVTLTLEDVGVEDDGVDATADEPVFPRRRGGRLGDVGRLRTFGGAQHRAGLRPGRAGQSEDGFEIDILGERRPARLAREPLVDPSGGRMRA